MARAGQIIDALSKKDFHAVVATFSPEVAKGLPEPQLAAVWTKLEQQAGVLSKCDAPVTTSSDPVVITATCKFANAALDVVLAFDKQGQVAGLHLQPHQAAAVAWTPPPYSAVDTVTRDMAAAGLPGTLTLPAGKGPWPAIVLVHGSGPQDRDETIGPNKVFADLAAGLAAHGIATLRYDKRTKVNPGSLPKDFTVDDETTKDALAAVDAVRAAPEIDGKRVYVAGHSLGAYLAPRIGSRAKDLAGLIVLAGPTRDLADVVVDQVTYLGAGSDAIANARRPPRSASTSSRTARRQTSTRCTSARRRRTGRTSRATTRRRSPRRCRCACSSARAAATTRSARSSTTRRGSRRSRTSRTRRSCCGRR